MLYRLKIRHNARGFTLIELVVSMAVIAILVLLAMPRFSGYARQAKITQAQHDAKVIENSMEEYLINNAEFDDALGAPVENEMLQGIANRKNLVHTENEALVETVDSVEYFHLPEEYIRTVLKIKKPSRDRAFTSKDGHVLIDIEGGELFLVGGGSFFPPEEGEGAEEATALIPTPDSYFQMDPLTDTLYDFYPYGINGLLPRIYDVVIPEVVDGVNVFHIAPGAFNEGSGQELTSVVIPETVRSIGHGAFTNNYLTELTIPSSVESIGYNAFQYNRLESVTLNEGLRTIGSSAFSRNMLKSVTIPGSVTLVDDSAFGENEIVTVVIREGLTSIENGAFSYNLIETLHLPDSVENIRSYAFAHNNISELRLGLGLKSIGTGTFKDNLLESVYIPVEPIDMGSQAFTDNGPGRDSNNLYGGYNLYLKGTWNLQADGNWARE